MRRRVPAALMILVGLVAACTSDGGGDERASLRIQVSGEPEETAVYDVMVRSFEELNPNIDVELVKLAEKDDHLARLTTSFAAGDPPDVFLVNYREYSQFVVRGAVEAVGPYFDQAGVHLEQYYPEPVEAFTYDGELQCMPQNVSSLVVYYNVRLFRRAGLGHPRAWDWEEFRAAARKLTSGRVDGVGIEPQIIRVAPFVWGNGGDVVDDLDTPTRFTLGDPAARGALEFVLRLVRDDRVVPTEKEVAAQDLESRFITGKLGMFLSSRRDTPVFREVPGFNWDVAPLPRGREPAGILHSDAYCMSQASEEHDAAFDFVRFATGREGQALGAFSGRVVPSLKPVANSRVFLDPNEMPRHSRVFLQGIPHIRRTPVIPTWPEIEDVAEELMTRAFYEPDYTLDRFLRELDKQTRPLFEEAAQE